MLSSVDFNLDVGQEVDLPGSCITEKKVEKSVDDNIPLPDPYPLPKHFKTDVEFHLKQRRMSTHSRRVFLSDIAASMLAYKQYPSKDDYTNVALSVISKYPFLKAPKGSDSPHVSHKTTNYYVTLLLMHVITHNYSYVCIYFLY